MREERRITPGSSGSLIRKLWQYCNVLRDDGLSYPDYVEQLTYLLFLKMADELQFAIIPKELSWQSFGARDTASLYEHYSYVLLELGSRDGLLGIIFRNAKNKIRDPAKLRLLIVNMMDQVAWSELSFDVKGDAYEGLLEKNAQDTKSGAGQYFTPRPLIDAIVECVRPQPGELICDPACGTGGFLLAAHEYITKNNPGLTPSQREHLATTAIRGVELVEEVARLAMMNLLLHDIRAPAADDRLPVVCADSLDRPSPFKADVVLTNPPFGVKGSVTFTQGKRRAGDDLTMVREDFLVQTSNKQLNFIQHVMSMLSNRGRCAIVVPDNVLFESGAAAAIRRHLLEAWELHTLLRLPTGLFYAQGVKANVLFFKAKSPEGTAQQRVLWVYDLRSGMRFSRTAKPLRSSDLDDFVAGYHARERSDGGTEGHAIGLSDRWRGFSVDDILRARDSNLDITWKHPPVGGLNRRAGRLDELAGLIEDDLRMALEHIGQITGRQPVSSDDWASRDQVKPV